MSKLRALALLALSIGGITGSSTAFAGWYFYPECYLTTVWTYYGWAYQYVCV